MQENGIYKLNLMQVSRKMFDSHVECSGRNVKVRALFLDFAGSVWGFLERSTNGYKTRTHSAMSYSARS